MTHDRFFDQIANPNYKEQFEQKLSDLYRIGGKLAKEFPDEVHAIDDQPDGPKGYILTFHQESLIEAGLSDDFMSGELVFFDEFDRDGERHVSGTSLILYGSHEVEDIVKIEIETGEQPVTTPTGQTNTVIIGSHYTIYDPESTRPKTLFPVKNDRWPLGITHSFVDLEGNNVLPIFENPETSLAAGRREYLDLYGEDMLIKLMEIEARLRQTES